MMAVSIVAIRPKAVGKGPYLCPSQRVSTTPTTNWTTTATSGERQRRFVWAKIDGRILIRPMAYQVLVVAFAAAFELAMAEFAMARKTTTQPTPHTLRARASQGFPPPKPAKSPNLPGPKNTAAA